VYTVALGVYTVVTKVYTVVLGVYTVVTDVYTVVVDVYTVVLGVYTVVIDVYTVVLGVYTVVTDVYTVVTDVYTVVVDVYSVVVLQYNISSYLTLDMRIILLPLKHVSCPMSPGVSESELLSSRTYKFGFKRLVMGLKNLSTPSYFSYYQLTLDSKQGKITILNHLEVRGGGHKLKPRL